MAIVANEKQGIEEDRNSKHQIYLRQNPRYFLVGPYKKTCAISGREFETGPLKFCLSGHKHVHPDVALAHNFTMSAEMFKNLQQACGGQMSNRGDGVGIKEKV